MTKHAHPRTLKPGGFSHKLASLTIGESMLLDVADRKEFNRKRDHTKLALKVPALAGMQFDWTLYHCSNLAKPTTNCLIMRITRLADKPASPIEEAS